MSVPDRYVKNSREGRKTKVSSINLEHYQSKLLKEQGLNLSLIVRDLLDSFLSKEFPDRYEALKKLDRVEIVRDGQDD